jgi:hypothetical protein
MTTPAAPTRKKRRRSPPEPPWARLTDEQLLSLRFCDLGLTLRGTVVERKVREIERELKGRGLRFRPHVWLSEEWFSPDGVPGLAVPFYMAHPRLMRLERRMMLEAEGGNSTWLTRILRHEIGHALDNAFRLRRRKAWRQVFGPASRRYPDTYRPRPASQKFVLHLGRWYAQSHPTEDFAETFAVWLTPKARWRAEYAGWPALAKLEFVDRLMTEHSRSAPSKRDRSTVEPLADNNRTLGEHYRRRAYQSNGEPRYDSRLLRVFAPRGAGESAERLLNDLKPQLMRALLRRFRTHPYPVHQVLRAVRRRARHLNLGVRGGKRDIVHEVTRLHERIFTDFLRRNEETYFL